MDTGLDDIILPASITCGDTDDIFKDIGSFVDDELQQLNQELYDTNTMVTESNTMQHEDISSTSGAHNDAGIVEDDNSGSPRSHSSRESSASSSPHRSVTDDEEDDDDNIIVPDVVMAPSTPRAATAATEEGEPSASNENGTLENEDDGLTGHEIILTGNIMIESRLISGRKRKYCISITDIDHDYKYTVGLTRGILGISNLVVTGPDSITPPKAKRPKTTRAARRAGDDGEDAEDGVDIDANSSKKYFLFLVFDDSDPDKIVFKYIRTTQGRLKRNVNLVSKSWRTVNDPEEADRVKYEMFSFKFVCMFVLGLYPQDFNKTNEFITSSKDKTIEITGADNIRILKDSKILESGHLMSVLCAYCTAATH